MHPFVPSSGSQPVYKESCYIRTFWWFRRWPSGSRKSEKHNGRSWSMQGGKRSSLCKERKAYWSLSADKCVPPERNGLLRQAARFEWRQCREKTAIPPGEAEKTRWKRDHERPRWLSLKRQREKIFRWYTYWGCVRTDLPVVYRKTKSEIRAAACLLRSRNWRHLENSYVSEQKLFAVPGETAGK